MYKKSNFLLVFDDDSNEMREGKEKIVIHIKVVRCWICISFTFLRDCIILSRIWASDDTLAMLSL